MTEYLVIRKEEFHKQCFACGGSGSKKSQFQGHKFVKTCTYCCGKGFTVNFRTIEVPLIEALKELKVI